MKIAFLFSGQGSQYSGMGEELFKIYPQAQSLYDFGSEVLGFDIKKVCFDGPDEQLSKTLVSQPAIFVTSLLALNVAKANGINCDVVAGHSLGEYAAMVASDMLSVEDGFKVITARAIAMERCAQEHDGAMYAIVGCDAETVEKVCEEMKGYTIPVNYNSAKQTVIAGESKATENVANKFIELGFRAIKLNVSAAFHSELMRGAAVEFENAIQDIKFNKPSRPFYSNVYGKELTDFDNIPAYLAKHLMSPVHFTDELAAMSSNGVDTFIELGPGKVLSGLIKRTLKGSTVLNIEDEKSYQKTLSVLTQQGE